MSATKILIVYLSIEEMESVEEAREADSLSKDALVQKALRTFLFLRQRKANGERLFVEDVSQQYQLEVFLA